MVLGREVSQSSFRWTGPTAGGGRGGEADGAEQKLRWARQHFWREEEIEDWGAEDRFSMPEPGKIDLLWLPACSGGRALLPALGRIIYFSNSGREEARSAQPPPVRLLGRSAEAPAPGSEAAELLQEGCRAPGLGPAGGQE